MRFFKHKATKKKYTERENNFLLKIKKYRMYFNRVTVV